MYTQTFKAFGEEKLLHEWAKDSRCNAPLSTLWSRVGRLNKNKVNSESGWSMESIITTPAIRKQKFEAFGENKTWKEWSFDERCICTSYKLFWDRVHSGYSVEQALTEELLETAEECVGRTYHYIKVLNISDNRGKHNALEVKCQCFYKKCEKIFETELQSVKSGRTKSCGCLQKDKITKHGLRWHPLCSTWEGMVKRCSETAPSSNYKDYYGRGIRVCEKWKIRENRVGLKNFIKWAENKALEQGITLDDLYYKLNGKRRYYSIDRIDVDGNYEPSNCKWANRSEQILNQRKKIFYSEYLKLEEKYNVLLKENKELKLENQMYKERSG